MAQLFHFRSHPDTIDVLKTASIDYTSLANNITLGYDTEALVNIIARTSLEGLRFQRHYLTYPIFELELSVIADRSK